MDTKKRRSTKKDVVEEYHLQRELQVVPPCCDQQHQQPKKHVILQLRRPEAPTIPEVIVEDCNQVLNSKRILESKKSVCFWCCHDFTNKPIGLPIKYKNNHYHVCGNFCSYECAASFNFNSKELGQNMWESYHLLNGMAREMGISEPIQQAPSRFALSMFGGWMDIKEFRANHVKYNPLPFPMVPLVQVMDEVNNHNNVLCSKLSFVPLDNSRIMKAKQNIFNVYKKETIHEKMKINHESS